MAFNVVKFFNSGVVVFNPDVEVFYPDNGLKKLGVSVKKRLNSLKKGKKGLNLPLLRLYFAIFGFPVLLAVFECFVYDFVLSIRAKAFLRFDHRACHFRADVFDDYSAVFLSACDRFSVPQQFLFCQHGFAVIA